MLAQEQLSQAEKDKLEIDPNFDFREIAARPFSEITKNEIGMFKWSGIYHQLQTGYFMMRLRMPGGIFTVDQLRRAGELAIEYGQNELCITTRQCLQYHWLRKEDIYKVIEGMEETGITITNACGDVVRNVCTCPGMGVCKEEVTDTWGMVEAIADDPEFLEAKRNLPRKHKIAVSGCNSACGMQLLNCQSWSAQNYTHVDGTEEIGWIYYAGGGLGRNPYMAKKIFDFVPTDLVASITRAGVEAHDRYGERRMRKNARLKIVVDKYGQKGFAELILNLLKERGVEGLERIVVANDGKPDIRPVPFNGQSVVPEKFEGLNTVRVMIRRSEISGDEAVQFSDWAEEFGSGKIMFTPRQNLDIQGVPDAKVKELTNKMREQGYRLDGLDFIPDVVACVGTTMCNLAVSDTPNAYRLILDAFAGDQELWSEVGPLRINMNGCPNNCAHAWIADIGFRGRRLTLEDGGSEEGFTVFVGGRMDADGYIGKPVYDTTITDIVPTLRKLINVYLANRKSGAENFGAYARRIGPDTFKELLDAEPEFADHKPVNQRNLALTDVFEQVIEEASK